MSEEAFDRGFLVNPEMIRSLSPNTIRSHLTGLRRISGFDTERFFDEVLDEFEEFEPGVGDVEAYLRRLPAWFFDDLDASFGVEETGYEFEDVLSPVPLISPFVHTFQFISDLPEHPEKIGVGAVDEPEIPTAILVSLDIRAEAGREFLSVAIGEGLVAGQVNEIDRTFLPVIETTISEESSDDVEELFAIMETVSVAGRTFSISQPVVKSSLGDIVLFPDASDDFVSGQVGLGESHEYPVGFDSFQFGRPATHVFEEVLEAYNLSGHGWPVGFEGAV